MALHPDTMHETRVERLLGLGIPKLRSPLWVGFLALFTASIGGWILWRALSGGWDEQGYVVLASLFLSLHQLCDDGGSLVYLRRGAAWGRFLRVLGFAVVWPLAMALFLIGFWLESSALSYVFFVLVALFLGVSVTFVAVRGLKELRRDARERGEA